MYSACDSKDVGLVLNPNGFRLKVKSWFKSLEELSSVTFSEFLRWDLVTIINWFFQTSFFVDFAKSFQPLWYLAFISKKMNWYYSILIFSSHHILIFVAFITTLLYLHLNFNFLDRVLLLYSNLFKLISSLLKVIWIFQCIIVSIMYLCQLLKVFFIQSENLDICKEKMVKQCNEGLHVSIEKKKFELKKQFVCRKGGFS